MKRIPRVSTRGYYDLSSAKTIRRDNYYLYPKKFFEDLHKYDEITIMIHGLRNNHVDALSKFVTAKNRLSELGYEHPVIGYSYDSNTRGANSKRFAKRALRVGQKIAKKNGKNLAKFLLDCKTKNPSLKIRLIGHSLGSNVIKSTVETLYHKKKENIIESVYLFGASIPDNSLSKKSGLSFQKTVKNSVVNYYNPYDEVLLSAVNNELDDLPLGLYGASTNAVISKYIQKKIRSENHRFASYAKVLKKFP